MGAAQFLDYSWLANILLLGVWAFLMFRRRLAHRYPLVTAFFVVGIFQAAGGYLITQVAGLGLRSQAYAWYWFLSKTLMWTLFFCVLIEIYKQMLAGYQGFQRLGQLFLYGALTLSAAFVLAVVWLDPPDPSGKWMAFWALEERSVFTALTCLALFLVGFGAYFRLRVSPDALVLLGVFGFICVGEAALWTLREFLGVSFRPFRDAASLALVLACLSVGAWVMARLPQEQTPDAFTVPEDAEAARIVASRLEHLNEALQKLLK